MSTVFKIAWRNIWRNKLRTAVILTAIIIGVWSVIFMTSFTNGMVSSYLDNAVQNETSHIQLHHPAYLKDKEIKYFINDVDQVSAQLKAKEGIKSISVRSITNAMLSTSKGARGIKVKGIDPVLENEVTAIASKLKEGAYFDDEKRNPILVSERLAKKLKVKLRSKVILTFQDLTGELAQASFRIIGIFNTGSAVVDEGNVFVRRTDLNRLMGNPNVNISPNDGEATTVNLDNEDSNIAHEFAIMLHDNKEVDNIATSLSAQFPNLNVETFRELAPELEMYETSMSLTGIIVMTIFMLALIFGIINTMLMAVLERFKELGMLMAVGMSKQKVFSMIVLETLLLGLIAAPIGLLLGYLTVSILGSTGIDLSSYGKGIEEFGMSTMVYPLMNGELYWQLALGVFITALLGSLYPAWKAIKLKPIEAIRKI